MAIIKFFPEAMALEVYLILKRHKICTENLELEIT